jgi:hypothetical protein
VLFLFAANFDEFTGDVVVIPVAIVLVFTLIAYLLMLLVFRKKEQAAIITSVVVLLALSYKRIFEPLKGAKVGGIALDQEKIVFGIVILLLMLTGIAIRKYSTRLRSTNKFLTYIAVFLLGLTLISIIGSEMRTGRVFSSPIVSTVIPTKTTDSSANYPDIYYFVFDRYASSTSLKRNYGFDNAKFEKYLKDKGFIITKDATANYPKTFLSLASSLNMEYVNYLTQKTNGGASTDQSIVTPLIQNNKVLKYLKGKGYTYIHSGSWWNPTASNPHADKNFIMKKGVYPGADEFTSGFLNTTIAASALKELLKDPSDVSTTPRNNDHRKRIMYQFNAVKEIPQMDSPKFVFVHILVPHDPFVLGKNCEPLPEKVIEKNSHQVNYINQLQCANQKIEEAVDHILKNSKKPPVIILQADEGPFPMNSTLSKDQAWKNVDDTALKEKFPILNAYLLPGKKETKLYHSITPVNSFRILLNEYFGEKYPLLEDKNYIFEDEKNYYKFQDVTERVQATTP